MVFRWLCYSASIRWTGRAKGQVWRLAERLSYPMKVSRFEWVAKEWLQNYEGFGLGGRLKVVGDYRSPKASPLPGPGVQGWRRSEGCLYSVPMSKRRNDDRLCPSQREVFDGLKQGLQVG